MTNTPDFLDSLRQSALWYGWGRQDAAHDERIDVFAFANQYGVLAQRPEGRPSIQQAWADFVAALPVACIVVPGKDGVTLWDCECAECKHLQGQWCDPEVALPDDVTVRCTYCHQALTLSEGVWVDDTDGDVCSGDDDLRNENESHVADASDDPLV